MQTQRVRATKIPPPPHHLDRLTISQNSLASKGAGGGELWQTLAQNASSHTGVA